MPQITVEATWKYALAALEKCKGGNVFGNNKYGIEGWSEKFSESKMDLYFNKITLFMGDDMIQVDRDYYRGRVTFKITYIHRSEYDAKKKGYNYTRETFREIIESRKGKRAFFQMLAEKVNHSGVCEYGYWNENKKEKVR